MNSFNDDFNNQNNPNGSNDFQNYNKDYMNEFSYKPEKKSRGRKILSGVIAVLSVFAIAATSIVGYTLVTGNRIGVSSSDSQSSDNQTVKIKSDC